MNKFEWWPLDVTSWVPGLGSGAVGPRGPVDRSSSLMSGGVRVGKGSSCLLSEIQRIMGNGHMGLSMNRITERYD